MTQFVMHHLTNKMISTIVLLKRVCALTHHPKKRGWERLCPLGCVLVHVKYFPENIYFPEMLFSGKENIFKCLVAFQKMF